MTNPRSQPWDAVDEASDESFPASDPPGWGSAHAVANPPESAPPAGPLELDDELPRVLLLVNAHRNTEIIAAAVGAGLQLRGFHVELGDAANRPPPPADYDAVVIGIAVGYPRDRVIESYLACFRSGLCDMPVAMFVVGTPRQCAHALNHAASEIGREPDVVASFPRGIFPWLPLWIEPHQIAELTEKLAAVSRAKQHH